MQRYNAVVGHGNPDARIFVISDAPGMHEDRQNNYLINSSKVLFEQMMQSISFSDDYYFTGIIKCFSLENFIYSDEDISNCSIYLHQQIKLVKPDILFVLGVKPAQILLKTQKSFNQLRNQVHQVNIKSTMFPVIISYHPAYLLRNPNYKKQALDDLILLKNYIK